MVEATEDGQRLKMMPVVNEHTRELSLEVERSTTAEDVLRTLAALFEEQGELAFILSENGPEFLACAIKRWLSVYKNAVR